MGLNTLEIEAMITVVKYGLLVGVVTALIILLMFIVYFAVYRPVGIYTIDALFGVW